MLRYGCDIASQTDEMSEDVRDTWRTRVAGRAKSEHGVLVMIDASVKPSCTSKQLAHADSEKTAASALVKCSL